MAGRHARSNLNGLELWTLIASGGASITRSSGSTDQDADVTVAANSTGNYTLTVNPFRGPKGEAYGIPNPMTNSLSATITSLTYTGDSLAVVIEIESDASTATDAAVLVHLYAE